MTLPLPPPPGHEADGDEGVSRVRMSGYLPETTARELPRLPEQLGDAWNGALDDDDEDMAFEEAFAGLHGGPGEPTRTIAEPLPAGMVGDREELTRTVVAPAAGVRLTVPARKGNTGRISIPPTAPPPLPALPPLKKEVRDPDETAAAAMPPPPMVARPPSRPERPERGDRAHPTGRGPAPAAAPFAPVVPGRQGSAGALVGGRYQIMERIGQGGMGKVYKVQHAQLGKVFALKLIGEELAATPEARELFYREARLASSLQHPNIAAVNDFGEDERLGLFMVMELVEGEPLAKLLHREGRLSVRTACEIILQVAEALHYIHANDIVHCDIKTENILITETQGTKRRQLQVKLLDFGLARSLRTSRITSSLSGTPHYVAPERIRGEPPSRSSDIYGVGILFYELLTGKVPWDGHVAQILAGHLEQAPTPPSTLIDGGLDPALEKLVLHALAKKPIERHKDMAAFLYELRTVMDMLGYNRRARRGGPRRVVIERTKNERDAMTRTLFERCRLPLALINPQGLILVANPSFARFVMGVEVEVEGLTVQATPLVSAWDAFETDLARAIGGHGVRRILEVDVNANEVRRLLMWLDPGGPDLAVLGVQPLDV